MPKSFSTIRRKPLFYEEQKLFSVRFAPSSLLWYANCSLYPENHTGDRAGYYTFGPILSWMEPEFYSQCEVWLYTNRSNKGVIPHSRSPVGATVCSAMLPATSRVTPGW